MHLRTQVDQYDHTAFNHSPEEIPIVNTQLRLGGPQRGLRVKDFVQQCGQQTHMVDFIRLLATFISRHLHLTIPIPEISLCKV